LACEHCIGVPYHPPLIDSWSISVLSASLTQTLASYVTA
jgi:hypothetical protein